MFEDQYEIEELDQDAKVRRLALMWILEKLFGAGFFRVRLTGLSDFDKVIGGLCWAITASGEIIDVDLFFQENLHVGQRIRLSENIVKALRGMKCPFDLQAHQIQGGDFPALKPIIDWLCSRVEVTRQLTSNLVRLFAELQYRKVFSSSSDNDASSGQRGTWFSSLVERRYAPSRKYRVDRTRVADSTLNSPEGQIRLTLLEFGEKAGENDSLFARPSVVGLEGDDRFEKQYRAILKQTQRDEDEKRKRANDIDKELFAAAREEEKNASQDFSNLKDNDMVAAEDRFRRECAENEARTLEFMSKDRSVADKRKIKSLESRLAKANEKLEECKQLESNALASATKYESKVRKELAKIEKAHQEVALLESRFSGIEDQKSLCELEALFDQNTSLREQEKAFKVECKASLLALEAEREALLKESEHRSDPGEERRHAEIEKVYQEVSARYNQVSAALAASSMRVSECSRAIDNVPTRSELIQYERRFVELYEQLASKLEENRRHVTTYNTLETIYELLEKEASLLQSVNDTFRVSMGSKMGRIQFLEQFQGIITGLRGRLNQLNRNLSTATTERSAKEYIYQNLLEQQRKYFQAVKDFQVECDRNEQLENRRVASQ
eukprot:CAMPEP_0203762498 /NCGR_PEP_ID=MMETSP0098-20131031/15373_1 /ASSEMBLY_ACC=CAM_ASM_000208 /TAXON_ID=96639 /ORGANISM=" , Strain NY0313808BC1" /LENGTH=612 /DNA_ID=CAMNT_0050656935 /DNA_START=17 /DNA_END=1855 /DNA_ORIENTATION=+